MHTLQWFLQVVLPKSQCHKEMGIVKDYTFAPYAAISQSVLYSQDTEDTAQKEQWHCKFENYPYLYNITLSFPILKPLVYISSELSES